MIISRTPLRVSFFGGGTDYPQWYLEHGGAVLATSIDKYCYVMLHNGKVWSTFDLPTRAGLGSSSAFTVGLLRVCTSFDQYEIAKLATVWEQDKLGGNIGAQDQYICAVGGFKILKISEAGIRPLLVEGIDWLNQYLLLFNTHQYRMAGKVVANQLNEMKRHKKVYNRLLDVVSECAQIIKEKDYQSFGKLLDESWSLKRQLSKYISTPEIDLIYETAIKNGAIGGKLLGAGGGGFMIFLSKERERVIKSLPTCEYVPFKFESTGTQIIFEDKK